MIAVIAACAQNRVIGKDGRIPWDIPADKRRFRDLTMGHVLVMGRRTYEEIGRPLPGRETIVVSRTALFDAPHCTTASSLPQALALAGGRDVFICGGARLYREALPLADVLYLTELHAPFDGDTLFPPFDPSAFDVTERTDAADAIPCTFVTYRRRALSYAQAREALAQLAAQKGIVPGLGPLRALLARLGNPQDRLPVVHIAGTNGKGSTLAMIAAMLRAAGYRVASFSSPAVFHARECWQIDGDMIPETDYAAWMTRLLALCAAMRADGQTTPTAFELETALAFCWFAQNDCDIAVIECGMGGCDDATNVVRTTAVSVLTSIGMDHTRFLGDTIEQIARAKAGICKPGVPVVLQGQDARVERTVAALCRESGCPLTVVRPERCTVTRADAHGIVFDSETDAQVAVSLPGLVQARNAATAIAAVRCLTAFPVSDEAMRRGLRAVRWEGRMQLLGAHPPILIDGAHNPDAAARLREEVLRRWPDGGVVEIAGVLADKEFAEVGRLMAPLARHIVTVTPDNPRALPAQQLAACLRQFCGSVEAADSVPQALRHARAAAGEDGAIVAFGSLSWLRALRQAVEEDL